ncbi:MAG: hypothetical protein V4710_17695, partial [Verrucomicrobiota bacterium]
MQTILRRCNNAAAFACGSIASSMGSARATPMLRRKVRREIREETEEEFISEERGHFERFREPTF